MATQIPARDMADIATISRLMAGELVGHHDGDVVLTEPEMFLVAKTLQELGIWLEQALGGTVREDVDTILMAPCEALEEWRVKRHRLHSKMARHLADDTEHFAWSRQLVQLIIEMEEADLTLYRVADVESASLSALRLRRLRRAHGKESHAAQLRCALAVVVDKLED